MINKLIVKKEEDISQTNVRNDGSNNNTEDAEFKERIKAKLISNIEDQQLSQYRACRRSSRQ